MTQENKLPGFDPQSLQELADARMPYGRYKDRRLCDLPEPYLVWYRQKGFPKGKLGQQLAAMFEIKVNGLEYLIRKIPEVKKSEMKDILEDRDLVDNLKRSLEDVKKGKYHTIN